MTRTRVHPEAFAALAVIALAFGIRAWHAAAAPLWLDEAYSLYAAEHGWWFLWHVAPRYETHPPFYYSLVRVWIGLFGSSVGALRALSVIAGTLGVGAAMLAACEAARLIGLLRWQVAGVALGTGLLTALSPGLVAMARDVRPYAVLILVYAGTIWMLLRLARASWASAALPRGALAGYLVGLALVLWLHNLGVLYAGALSLALLILVIRRGMNRADWIALVVGHLVVAIVYLPALAILRDQAPTWVKSTWLTFSWPKLPWRFAMIYAVATIEGMVLAVLATIAALVTLFATRPRARLALALFVMAAAPLACSILVSATIAPIFIPRTMTALAVPLFVLIGFGLAGPMPVRFASGTLIAVLAFGMAQADYALDTRRAEQDWYRAVAWLKQRMRPGDEIWAYPNEGALPLGYALRDRGVAALVRPIPVAVPAIGVGGWYPTGSRGVVSLSRIRLRAIADGGRAIPTIWLMRLGANAYDVDDVFLDELSRDRTEVGAWDGDPIDIVGLRRE